MQTNILSYWKEEDKIAAPAPAPAVMIPTLRSLCTHRYVLFYVFVCVYVCVVCVYVCVSFSVQLVRHSLEEINKIRVSQHQVP
jgi:hypothetical protein